MQNKAPEKKENNYPDYDVFYKKYGVPAVKPYRIAATSEKWARTKFNRFNTGCSIIKIEKVVPDTDKN